MALVFKSFSFSGEYKVAHSPFSWGEVYQDCWERMFMLVPGFELVHTDGRVVEKCMALGFPFQYLVKSLIDQQRVVKIIRSLRKLKISMLIDKVYCYMGSIYFDQCFFLIF